MSSLGGALGIYLPGDSTAMLSCDGGANQKGVKSEQTQLLASYFKGVHAQLSILVDGNKPQDVHLRDSLQRLSKTAQPFLNPSSGLRGNPVQFKERLGAFKQAREQLIQSLEQARLSPELKKTLERGVYQMSRDLFASSAEHMENLSRYRALLALEGYGAASATALGLVAILATPEAVGLGLGGAAFGIASGATGMAGFSGAIATAKVIGRAAVTSEKGSDFFCRLANETLTSGKSMSQATINGAKTGAAYSAGMMGLGAAYPVAASVAKLGASTVFSGSMVAGAVHEGMECKKTLSLAKKLAEKGEEQSARQTLLAGKKLCSDGVIDAIAAASGMTFLTKLRETAAKFQKPQSFEDAVAQAEYPGGPEGRARAGRLIRRLMNNTPRDRVNDREGEPGAILLARVKQLLANPANANLSENELYQKLLNISTPAGVKTYPGPLSDAETIARATDVLGLEAETALTKNQKTSLLKAHHQFGDVPMGKLSTAQLREKAKTLREGGWSLEQISALLRSGTAGSNLDENAVTDLVFEEVHKLAGRLERKSVPVERKEEALKALIRLYRDASSDYTQGGWSIHARKKLNDFVEDLSLPDTIRRAAYDELKFVTKTNQWREPEPFRSSAEIMADATRDHEASLQAENFAKEWEVKLRKADADFLATRGAGETLSRFAKKNGFTPIRHIDFKGMERPPGVATIVGLEAAVRYKPAHGNSVELQGTIVNAYDAGFDLKDPAGNTHEINVNFGEIKKAYVKIPAPKGGVASSQSLTPELPQIQELEEQVMNSPGLESKLAALDQLKKFYRENSTNYTKGYLGRDALEKLEDIYGDTSLPDVLRQSAHDELTFVYKTNELGAPPPFQTAAQLISEKQEMLHAEEQRTAQLKADFQNAHELFLATRPAGESLAAFAVKNGFTSVKWVDFHGLEKLPGESDNSGFEAIVKYKRYHEKPVELHGTIEGEYEAGLVLKVSKQTILTIDLNAGNIEEAYLKRPQPRRGATRGPN